jgi:hypothetical protein
MFIIKHNLRIWLTNLLRSPFQTPRERLPAGAASFDAAFAPEAKTVFVSKSGMIKRMNDKNPDGKQIRLTSLSSCAG